ncbi:MAG: hypothetical protein LBM64_03990 [Deltaproteobacteria bacterium]|jgi:hypothetical protein|nr:hypothetical protein [Deltaproteobacteria bacterium]
MHTKLPEFIAKMKNAAKKGQPEKAFALRGLENLKSAKMQSLRTGRIEEAVAELASRPDVERVELIVMPRVPETMHTVVIKGIAADGSSPKAVVDVVNILHPTEEVELENCREVEDRRPAIGRH